MSSVLTRTVLPLIATLAVATFAVVVDLHNDEVQAAVLVILVGGFMVGVIWPAAAWRWALILGLSIVIGDPLGVRLGVRPPWPETGWNAGALVALIPAFIGTYVGVGVRSLIGAGAAAA